MWSTPKRSRVHLPRPMTTIQRHLVITGELSSDEDLTIEGSIQGLVIVRGATLTIEAPARVEADVRAARVLVRGEVHGTISASERIELGPSSTVVGNLSADQVAIAAGAYFSGCVDMGRRAIAAKIAEYRATQVGAGSPTEGDVLERAIDREKPRA